MSIDAASSPDSPPKGAMRIIFLIAITDFMGFGIILPLLPLYVPEHATEPLKATLLTAIYSLCQFVAAPILGAWSDRAGRRPILVISQIGSSIGYLVLGLATHFSDPTLILWMVYISRIIDGISGGNISTAQAYIADITTPATRGKAMGMLGAAFGIGFCIGPAVGGILGHFNPSLPGYMAAAFSALAAGISYARLPETRTHRPVEAEAWLHPSTFTPVLANRPVRSLILITFAIMGAFVMMETTTVIFLEQLLGWEKLGSGLYYAYIGVVITIIQGALVGRLIKRFGEWKLAVAGPVLVALGMLGISASVLVPEPEMRWMAILLLLVFGASNAIGRSILQPSSSALLSRFTTPEQQGATFGLSSGMASIARILGPIIAGLAYPFFKNTGQFLTAAVISIAVAIWTLSVARKYPLSPAPRGEAILAK